MTDMKNDPNKPSSNQNKGSGSDTASAAKISAGTSVGNVGQSPMPQAQGGGSAQNASQGAKPGGQSSGQSSGAGKDQQSHASSGGAQHGSGQSKQGQQGQQGQGRGSSMAGDKQSGQGAADTVRQTAEQVQEKAGEVYEQATEWAQDTYERATSWASDAFEQGSDQFSHARSRSTQGMGSARRGVQRYVAQNPVMVGLVGLAAGVLLGSLLPRTRREDETFGTWADEVREQGLRYAQDMTERGREFVDEAFTGDDPRFGKHESEFRPNQGGPGNR